MLMKHYWAYHINEALRRLGLSQDNTLGVRAIATTSEIVRLEDAYVYQYCYPLAVLTALEDTTTQLTLQDPPEEGYINVWQFLQQFECYL